MPRLLAQIYVGSSMFVKALTLPTDGHACMFGGLLKPRSSLPSGCIRHEAPD